MTPTAKLHVIGSAHEARFGEDFDRQLADLLSRCHDAAAADRQLDELTLLTVLAEFAAPGRWDPADPTPAAQAARGPAAIDQFGRVRWYPYAVFYPPGDVVDVVSFEGYTVSPEHTVVRSADVVTSGR